MTAPYIILAIVQLLGMVWACRVTADAAEAEELPLWWRTVLIVVWPLTGLLVLLGNVQ